MSKLTKGEVTITLAGTDYTLKPTLQAFSVLGSRYGNHSALLGKIFAGDVPTLTTVLRQGLGFNDQQAKKLPQMMFASGVPSLIEPVSNYVFRLFNGGKSAEEVLAEQSAEDVAADLSADQEGDEGEENPLLAGA
ncbi:hypothetical protein [Azospirillum agricola]|uniref:hypothetical protein n=1 Tax=Azospirillum agricola TaxID=1720247 RepID=UPI000A0F0CE3|nr:hypothetical protein [Azospirillum agricola]SMH29755.1 hypothetical protein SAMN02982994_0222 [Azospirillum lipoferum]